MSAPTGTPPLGDGVRVLVVEDDEAIAEAVCRIVAKLGGDALRAADGREALRRFFEDRPDLVVLDVGLPVLDGWEVLERIRDLSEVPILMLTAHDLDRDKVRGLQAGADDYLTKPFSVAELAARIVALLRRSRRPAGGSVADGPAVEASVLRDGPLEVDWVGREVRVDGEVVALTPLEFRLLQAFVRHPGQALSTEQLLELAWSDPFGIGPERVKFTVLRLRRKLGWTHDGPAPLEAVRGYGYRYTPGTTAGREEPSRA